MLSLFPDSDLWAIRVIRLLHGTRMFLDQTVLESLLPVIETSHLGLLLHGPSLDGFSRHGRMAELVVSRTRHPGVVSVVAHDRLMVLHYYLTRYHMVCLLLFLPLLLNICILQALLGHLVAICVVG